MLNVPSVRVVMPISSPKVATNGPKTSPKSEAGRMVTV